MTEQILRAFRPKTLNFVPGIGSIIDGFYYFDGMEIHVIITVKMAPTATYPMGVNPVILTPSEIDLLSDYLPFLSIGNGSAHDSGQGKVHDLTVVIKDAISVGLWVPVSPWASVQAGVPISWNANSILRLKFSYIPKNKVLPKNFTAYGDSITRFETNTIETFSWANKVAVEGLTFGGGYAKDGGTSAQILAGSKKLLSDNSVCMVGVNDIAQNVPVQTILNNVSSLADKLESDNFVLCKIPPYDANPGAVTTLNEEYELLASAKGWDIIDPFAAYRTVNGTWIPGASYDGVHPYEVPQTGAAMVVRNHILM